MAFSINPDAHCAMVHSAAPPKKIQNVQSKTPFVKSLLSLCESANSFSSGIGDLQYSTKAAKGTTDHSKDKYIQFSAPNTFMYSVLSITTQTTPQAYIEWSLLISLSGLSLGIAATTGLTSTSARPEPTEKITVLRTIQR